MGRKKIKNKMWIITVPKQLDKETRQFVERNNSSFSNFVRKSIHYLTEDEQPQQNEKKRSVLWVVSLHPSLHKKALELARSNYPSKSSLVRYAVTRQLTAEIYMDEKTKDLLIENKDLRRIIRTLNADVREFAEKYFDLLSRFRDLKKVNAQLKKEREEQKRK